MSLHYRAVAENWARGDLGWWLALRLRTLRLAARPGGISGAAHDHGLAGGRRVAGRVAAALYRPLLSSASHVRHPDRGARAAGGAGAMSPGGAGRRRLYVCQGAQCGAPIRDLAALDEAIRKEVGWEAAPGSLATGPRNARLSGPASASPDFSPLPIARPPRRRSRGRQGLKDGEGVADTTSSRLEGRGGRAWRPEDDRPAEPAEGMTAPGFAWSRTA